jgi:hypothetical protein
MSGSESARLQSSSRTGCSLRHAPDLTPDIPAGYEPLARVANTVRLIYGTRDAVLVDTFLTLDGRRAV